MTKRIALAPLAAFVLCCFPLASCSSGFLGQRSGTIVISTGPAPGARALTEGWPMGDNTLPEFSTLVVVVSGADMSTLVTNIDLATATYPIELEIKAGLQRLVSVVAVPDWEATATTYPDADLPTLAASFSGGTVVDVPADSVVPVTVEQIGRAHV